MLVFSNEWMSEMLNQEVGFSMTRDNRIWWFGWCLYLIKWLTDARRLGWLVNPFNKRLLRCICVSLEHPESTCSFYCSYIERASDSITEWAHYLAWSLFWTMLVYPQTYAHNVLWFSSSTNIDGSRIISSTHFFFTRCLSNAGIIYPDWYYFLEKLIRVRFELVPMIGTLAL